MRWCWVLGLIAFLCACSADRKTFGPADGLGGSSQTAKGGAGNAGKSSGGTSGGAGPTADALAPVIEITSPRAVSDPATGDVLVVDSAGVGSVDVVCKVTPSTARGAVVVDVSTIKIALLDMSGTVVREVAGAALGSNQYKANFVLTTVPAGVIRFRCSASDTARQHPATKTIATFLDHGPTITVTSPAPDSAYPRASVVHFEFAVAPAPLTDTDPGADVTTVTLTANGVAIDISEDPKRPGVYSAEVDFSDTSQFPAGLTGTISVAIDATDSRTPVSATQTKAYTILLDGSSPVVTIKSPASNSLLGGQVQLTFTAIDEKGGSGVDLSNLVVTLGTTEYVYDPKDPAWTMMANGTFTFAFDSTKFDGSVSQVTVVVRASDLAGNGPASAQMFLYLDNAAPFVTLTPFNMRAITHSTDGKETYCSIVFDPLGDTMPDASVGGRFMRFRAFGWDFTNGVPSQDNLYYSGIDKAHVKLYLQPDSSQPIILDTNGDGACDAVVPEVKLLPSLDLLPVPSTGAPDNNPPDLTSPPAVPSQYTCKPQTMVPPKLCAGHVSELTYVIRQNYGTQRNQSSNDAAIYAGSVGAADSLSCTGEQWDVASVTKDGVGADGWVCLVAEAIDTAGNIGISAPLRVCLDDETVPGSPPCALSSIAPPACTQACTPPKRGFHGDDAQGNPLPFILEYL